MQAAAAGRRGKKRIYLDTTAEEEKEENAFSSSSTKHKRIRTVSIEQLDPFGFLITYPPIAYMQYYTALSSYLEGAINHDFEVSSHPFAIYRIDLSLSSSKGGLQIKTQVSQAGQNSMEGFDESESTSPRKSMYLFDEESIDQSWTKLINAINDPLQLTVRIFKKNNFTPLILMIIGQLE